MSGGKSTLTVSSGGDNAGVQQYTVTGLGTDKVDIVLADPSNVSTDANGQTTFKVASGANTATLGTGVGEITVVNGVGNTGNHAYGVTPVNGQVTFTIDSSTPGGTVPVVFSRADNNDTLSVDSNGAPTEPFGVGTETTYLPEEAGAGNVTTEPQITSVNKDANYLVAGDLYNYGNAGDTYYVVAAKGATPTAADQVTLDGFEASLSKGDYLGKDTVYNPKFGSKFVLEDVTPAAPASADATAESATSVKVTWTAPSTGAPDSYNIYRASGTTAPAKLSGYSKIGSVAGDAKSLSYTDNGLSAKTTYYYAVTAVQDGDESTDTDATVTTPDVTETVAPTITNTQIATDAATKGMLGNGDSFVVDFSEAMNSTASSGFLRLSDSDSTYQVDAGPLTDGPSSKDANDRMVVTVGTPTLVSGKDDGLDFAGDTVKITLASAGFDDLAGNQLDLANSSDVVVDDEGAVDAAAPTFTTGPTVTSPAAGEISGSGTAADNTGVSNVTYAIMDAAGKVVASGNATPTAAPYGDASEAFTFDETGLTAGTYSVKVTAFDAAGNSTSDTTTGVTVS